MFCSVLHIRSTPALEFRPGDEIRVHCVYASLSRTATTYYGQATSDEMCFGIVTYYPAVPKFTYCGQWRTVDECSNDAGYVCDLKKANALWEVLQYTCAQGCSCACRETLKHVNTTGCMSGDAGQYLLKWYRELQQVIDLQHLCATVGPTSHQLALQPLWPLHSSAALLAISYLVIHFM